MERRDFLRRLLQAGCHGCWGGAGITLLAGSPAQAASAGEPARQRRLILVELKGGNDGLNTVVPHADPLYARLRPRLALPADSLLPLDDGKTGLHPALSALLPLWQAGQLAIVQSVGYPEPNLSHFRSIEIWETASRSDQFLHDGWLTRAFRHHALPARRIAEGVCIGASDSGPLLGSQALMLNDPARFRQQASRLMKMDDHAPDGSPLPAAARQNNALRHLLQVEAETRQAAARLAGTSSPLQTVFPRSGFGETVRTACQVLAAGHVGALRLTLSGFDTHRNQLGTHAALLRQLAEGLAALHDGLQELQCWDSTLILTYGEFGRRAAENQSGGTDHGTAAPHFLLGGAVRGGLYGQPPALHALDGRGNLPFSTDFRQLYATVLRSWWGMGTAQAAAILGGQFAPLPVL